MSPAYAFVAFACAMAGVMALSFPSSGSGSLGNVARFRPATRSFAVRAESPTYSQLKGQQVYSAVDLKPVDISTLWKEDEKAVVVFFRSFG